MFAWIVFSLVIIHLGMMTVGPMIVLKEDAPSKKTALKAVVSWFAFFCGYAVLSWILKYYLEPAFVHANWYGFVGLLAWLALFTGLAVVIRGFKKAAANQATAKTRR